MQGKSAKNSRLKWIGETWSYPLYGCSAILLFLAPTATIVALGFAAWGLTLLLFALYGDTFTKCPDTVDKILFARHVIVGLSYLVAAVLLLANPTSAIALPLLCTTLCIDMVTPAWLDVNKNSTSHTVCR
jgi:hypothetical protein